MKKLWPLAAIILLALAMPASAQDRIFAKGFKYSSAAPGANTNIFATNFTPIDTVSVFRVSVQLETASVFKARVTDGTTAKDFKLNGGNTVTAGHIYVFSFSVRKELQYNFQVETDGVIDYLLVEELGGTVVPMSSQGFVAGAGAPVDQVQGTAADGAAASGNPVQVGGKDGAGNIQAILTDTTGAVGLAAGTNNIGDVDVLSFPDNEPFNLSQVAGAAVTAGAGAVAAGTPRLTLASDDPAVTALQVIDDWDETNRAAVNLIASQVGVAGGTGVDAANVLRVSLATNVALPAGTNNIGDVDVLTIPALVAGTAEIGIVKTRSIAATQKTYRVTFNVAAGAAGTFLEIIGPSSGSAEILEIYLDKPSVAVKINGNKRSAASTLGTSTSRTLVPWDATDAAATSVVKQFTVDPTEGTLVGEVIPPLALGVSDRASLVFGEASGAKPPTLNAATQVLTLETDVAATLIGYVEIGER